MKKQEKLEAALRKAKMEWRRICDSPESSSADRRKALVAWKTARARRDIALALWRRVLADRRRTLADRRKASANADWVRANADRRKRGRRP